MSEPAVPGRLNRGDPDLGDRHRRVFAELLSLHAASARPIGSDAIAARTGVPWSATSVRGALADLELLGLVERAHASSGRVPTVAGWAFYVRTLLEPRELPPPLAASVDDALLRSTRDIEQLLHEAARVLAALTRRLGLAHADPLEDEPLESLDLEPLAERRTLLALGLGAGGVRTLVLELEHALEREALEAVRAVLRANLLGLTLSEARARLEADGGLVRDSAVRMVARAASESWERSAAIRLFGSGAAYLAGLPEFASGGQLAPVLEVVEHGAPLDRLMVWCAEGQAAARVGLDEVRALAGLSLVSYALPGSVRGAVGVLGPLRMDYALALAAVDAVGRRVADLLQP